MALYRMISNKFWEDSKIIDEFTPEDKYFYLYLLTNPHTTASGCYSVSYSQMVVETGYNRATIDHLLQKFVEKYAIIKFNNENNEILLLNWNKYNWGNSSIIRAAEKETKDIKTEEFKNYILNNIYNQSADSVLTGCTQSNSNRNSNRNRNRNSNSSNICAELSEDRLNTFSIILNDKTYYTPNEEQINRWKELYPNVNVENELHKMVGWSDANINNRKTKTGINRFINRWLSNAQDGPKMQRETNYIDINKQYKSLDDEIDEKLAKL